MKTLPFLRRVKPQERIMRLTAADAQAAQRLHAEAFPPGWDTASLHKFLADPQVAGFGISAAPVSVKHGKAAQAFDGFILARLIGPEAEILTFAVRKKQRRKGLGRALLEHLLRFLYQERAEALFLEADEHNAAALALYRALGFTETGRRKGYYQPAPPDNAKNSAAGKPAIGRSDAVLFEYRLKRPYQPPQDL